MRLKREKLEAWKKEREAKKAAGAVASPVAASSPVKATTSSAFSISLRTKDTDSVSQSAPLPSKPVQAFSSSSITSAAPTPSASSGSSSLPAKPSFSFTSNSTSTAFKPSNLKNSLSFGGNEDEAVVGVGMMKFDAIDEADLKVGGEDWDEDDEEDLDASASYKVRETGKDVDVDTEMVEAVEVVAEPSGEMEVESAPIVAEVVKEDTAMEEEEEVDELEAFMSGVTKQVMIVDESDRAKLLSTATGKKVAPVEGEPEVDEEDKAESEDEIDKVGMKAEDILACVLLLSPPTRRSLTLLSSCRLAAKKIKRGRELAPVNHSLIAYEPFRKEFYHPPPEVELLTAAEVEEMRAEMDGIKVRGADPPKPVSKWSYCGLPATWSVQRLRTLSDIR